jgi:secreted trypsin-like serine protease
MAAEVLDRAPGWRRHVFTQRNLALMVENWLSCKRFERRGQYPPRIQSPQSIERRKSASSRLTRSLWIVLLAGPWLVLLFMFLAPIQAHAQSSASPDIVGGEDAVPGEFPWQAFLTIGNFMCGGSLITSQWILTAAHCVTDENGQVVPTEFVTVYLGKHDLRLWESSEQIRGVTQILVHPQYDPYTADSDLALLRLVAPAVLNDRVRPVRLLQSPADDVLAEPGVLATVTGWGTLEEDGPISFILQKVSVPIVSHQTCNAALGGGITANMLCAGYAEGGKDSCQGDSGGPLIVPDGAGGWKQAGIVSFGYGCARPQLYGVYTRVSRFVEWIGQQVAPLSVSGFAPLRSRVGESVTITGTGFTEATSVEFDGMPASFTVASDSQLTAVVPEGALAGKIIVRTPFNFAQSAASFTPLYQLEVQSTAFGSVTVEPGNLLCTQASPCLQEMEGGVTAGLMPVAEPDFVFAGWRSSHCAQFDEPCILFMNSDRSALAVFAPPTSTLTLTMTGEGQGLVRLEYENAEEECADACSVELPTRTAVVLTAQPAPGMIFVGWGGDCFGIGPACTVFMIGDQQVAAEFAVERRLYLPAVRR